MGTKTRLNCSVRRADQLTSRTTRADRAFRTCAVSPGRRALIKLRVAGDTVLRRSRIPLVIPAGEVRAALRRSPPRMTIRAPILTREHAHDDEEADDRQQSEDDKGGG
jgi:hypothetical protein